MSHFTGNSEREEELIQRIDALQKYVDALESEVATAKKRLGPAGYLILTERNEFERLAHKNLDIAHKYKKLYEELLISTLQLQTIIEDILKKHE